MQATSQTEVENWIHCIHTSASAALARRKGKENITALLNEEMEAMQEKMLSDEKLKKMALLQLKIEKDANIRQTITDQVCWLFFCVYIYRNQHYWKFSKTIFDCVFINVLLDTGSRFFCNPIDGVSWDNFLNVFLKFSFERSHCHM